ncbi:conserved hypothetical protein [Coccidioides posadasii str. Silveira]|uniref:Uncharacterized protein n=1 Tax=Coccidioides posadasii (strain RMSCC 757 / Silveira) TaxID=443226 RepID=E9CVY8_COCPS|nr:conserved hypothetical protein [Coccidioides posadasii str. Silveira]
MVKLATRHALTRFGHGLTKAQGSKSSNLVANFLFLLSTSRFGCAQHPNSNGNMPGMGSRAVRLIYDNRAQDKSHGSNIRTDQSKDVASTSLRFCKMQPFSYSSTEPSI